MSQHVKRKQVEKGQNKDVNEIRKKIKVKDRKNLMPKNRDNELSRADKSEDGTETRNLVTLNHFNLVLFK